MYRRLILVERCDLPVKVGLFQLEMRSVNLNGTVADLHGFMH